jgi:hypothetical protein
LAIIAARLLLVAQPKLLLVAFWKSISALRVQSGQPGTVALARVMVMRTVPAPTAPSVTGTSRASSSPNARQHG